MSEHTPGPWELDGGTIRTQQGIIARCPRPNDDGTFAFLANARLIAAAPELLEALDMLLNGTLAALVDMHESLYDDGWKARIYENGAPVEARAAIAKARGES